MTLDAGESMYMPKVIRLYKKSDLVTLFLAYLDEVDIKEKPHPRTIYRHLMINKGKISLHINSFIHELPYTFLGR